MMLLKQNEIKLCIRTQKDVDHILSKKTKASCECVNYMGGILSQHVCIANHHGVSLNILQHYVLIKPQ